MRNSIKICIVSAYSYYFFTGGKKGRVGGAELDLFFSGKYLSQLPGFFVSFIVADFGQKKKENFEGITIFRSMKLQPDFWHYFLAPFKLFSSLWEADADVYICSPAGPEAGLTWMYCKVFGKKFIYRTAHEIDCNKEYVRKNGLFGWLYERGLLGASIIFTSVRNHEELLRKTYAKKIPPIKFVPYGLEMKVVDPKEKNYILWVARGEKWKNPQLFLDLTEAMPLEKFVMIMPKKAEEAGFHDVIRERASKMKNLTFIESVPFQDIQPYFDKAKVFVNTSEYEGFTFTLLQSGIGSTPIVYYKVNPDNIIDENNLGYCANGDIDKMKLYLREIISNQDDWSEKSKNIRNYISENHGIEKNILIWRDILEKL